jgi:hypothetical protein
MIAVVSRNRKKMLSTSEVVIDYALTGHEITDLSRIEPG